METPHPVRLRSCRTGEITTLAWEDLEDAIRNGTVQPDDAIEFTGGPGQWWRVHATVLWARLHGHRVHPPDAPPVEHAACEEVPPRYPGRLPPGSPDDPSPSGPLPRITFAGAAAEIGVFPPPGHGLLSQPGLFSALGVLGVLLYLVVITITPSARPEDSPKFVDRVNVALVFLLVMCGLGLVEHRLRPEAHTRGWAFLAGPLGMACYGVAALLVMALTTACQASIRAGHGDGLIGMVVVYPVVVFGPILFGIALGANAYRAGSKLWGGMTVLFLPLLLLCLFLFGFMFTLVRGALD